MPETGTFRKGMATLSSLKSKGHPREGINPGTILPTLAGPTDRVAPEPPDVLSPLEAGGLQPLIQAALDRGQSADPGPDNGHTPHHAVLPQAIGHCASNWK